MVDGFSRLPYHPLMHIVIVGGGIGGCAAALSLHAAGFHDVEVIEASAVQAEVGDASDVGINISPHAVRELAELGLAAQLDSQAVRIGELSRHDRHGRQVALEPLGLAAGYRWPQYAVQHTALVHVLVEAVLDRLGPDRMQFGRFLDAAAIGAVDADVVVACDGIDSLARGMLLPDEGPPLWSGVTMWRGTTEMPALLGGRRMVMVGEPRRRLVALPIRDLDDGRQVVSWVAEAEGDEPVSYVADLRFDWLDAPAMIDRAGAVARTRMVDREPLDRWRLGNRTLLGDAAHPMYPVGCNGASQAIVDARVLARELAHHEDPVAALDAYETERLPATTADVVASRRAATLMTDVASADEGARDADASALNERASWTVVRRTRH